MVIVRLVGGLGNQLFQYAAARRLTYKLKTQLKLDTLFFRNQELRTYSLDPFNISAPFATVFDLAALRGKANRRPWIRTLHYMSKILTRRQWATIHEDQLMPLDENVLQASGDIYLDGFWQSEKYFADAEDIIRSEISFRFPPSGLNHELAEMIGSAQSVSIHVRRGDYIASPQTFHIHGVCSINYYRECVDRISGLLSRPHFFVFSDDPVWCKENLSFLSPATFISHNHGKRGYEDLRLMSLCKHHIIANSSFSWWGAWLSSFSEKTVFAPAQWFRDASIDTRDLIPDSWIKVPNNAESSR
jgi:hypothetical protein